MKRYLKKGELAKQGDALHYGDGKVTYVRQCRYDPGCCVGHVVEAHESYIREEDIDEKES